MTQTSVNSPGDDGIKRPEKTSWPEMTVVPANDNVDDMSFRQVWSGMKAFRSATLGRQLLNTILPLSLAPLVVASMAGYTITQNRVQSQVDIQLEGQSLLTSAGVRQEIEGDLETLAGFALNPFVINLTKAAGDFAEAENLPQTSLDVLEDRFATTKQLSSNQALNDYLREFAATEGFSELILTEENSLTIGYSTEPSSFVQYRDQWWQQGRAQTQWISDPELDESAGTFGVSISQRIDDSNSGEFLGTLKAFIDSSELSFLNEFLQDAGISGSQQVQLLDVSSGFTLASFTAEGETVPENTSAALQITGGRTVSETAAKLVETLRGVQTISAEDVSNSLAGISDLENLRVREIPGVLEGQGFVVSFNYANRQYALSTVPRVDWVAIASMEISEIRAQGRGLLGVFGLIAAVLGGLATLITVGLSRRLSSPLNELSDKAQQVSDGNLNVTAEPKGSAETQSLAQTFNELVLRVKGFLGEQTLNARKATLFADVTGTKIDDAAALDELYNRIMVQARDILQTDRVVFYRFGDNWEGWVAAESASDKLPSALMQGLSDPCIPEETRARYFADEILQVDDVSAASFNPEHLQLLINLEVRSLLAVAVKSQGELYGLLIVHHCRSRHNWQASEIDFLRQLGTQLGLVIERIRLLEETEALAEEQRQIKEGLQRSALQLLMDVDPVSRGDLTVRAKVTEDEVGTIADSYNATITNLRKIVSQVKVAVEQVSTTTNANDESIRRLSTSALEQANEITVALDQTQEMAESVRQVAANAKDAERAVEQASQTVQEGDEAMNRTVDGIMAIRETVAETAKKVKRLGESSQKISNVVNLISGFAAQTNMLALNASIEASRAGEGGKGFAVVAEEVRELARQSAEATTEIEKLVAGIQTETNEVVLAMEEGTQQVVDGTKLVDETRQSLNRITTASEQISTIVDAITQATTLQSKASEDVTVSMTSVAEIANQNSEEANRVSSSFEELNTVAKALQEEVDRFKLS
ncbi:MAG: GAF domain-containing protein [Leptolyngbya sp. SIO1D8]|nr:GAF domain-containing protein [Leptolyngbya sp. SIO1D8]